LNIPLRKAKEIETDILDGKVCYLNIPENCNSEEVLTKLKTFGVKCKEIADLE
jgi:hypothetical protein